MMRVQAGVLVALLVATTVVEARAQVAAPPATLVMPFENSGSAPHLIWLSEGSSWLFAESLARYGANPVTREERVSAFERLQLPPAAVLSRATVIKVAQFVGATEVVVGGYQLTGDTLSVTVRVIALDEGRLKPEVVERGPLSDLFGIYDRAARRLVARRDRGAGAISRDAAGVAAGVRSLRQRAGRRVAGDAADVSGAGGQGGAGGRSRAAGTVAGPHRSRRLAARARCRERRGGHESACRAPRATWPRCRRSI